MPYKYSAESDLYLKRSSLFRRILLEYFIALSFGWLCLISLFLAYSYFFEAIWQKSLFRADSRVCNEQSQLFLNVISFLHCHNEDFLSIFLMS
jgi:hypothetical protein